MVTHSGVRDMDRIDDLKEAARYAGEAERHIYRMLMELEQGRDMPLVERSHAAGKLNMASEIIRRA